MKVAFLTEWFDPEPGAMHGLPLARWMRDRGHDVQVLTAIPNYPGGKFYDGYKFRLWQRECMDGIPVLRVGVYPSHDGRALRRILTYGSFALSSTLIGLPLLKPVDVAYVFHPPPTIGLPALAMHYLQRLPFLYHIADVWPDTVVDSGMVKNRAVKKIVESLLHIWCNHLYRRASHITVLAQGVKDLLENRGVPPEKLHAIYDWTNEEVFFPQPRDEEFAEQVGLKDTLNFVYAGNFGPMQAVECFVQAAALLRDVKKFRLVLAGTGPKEAELRALCSQLELDNVVFLGRRQYWEMPKVYSISDVLLIHLKDIPFYRTAIPSKAQVSLAVGRPILMGIRGDAANVIDQSGAGLNAEPENVESLAATMRTFCEMSSQRLQEMGERGYEFYRSHMSLDSGGSKVEALLTSMVARKHGRS